MPDAKLSIATSVDIRELKSGLADAAAAVGASCGEMREGFAAAATEATASAAEMKVAFATAAAEAEESVAEASTAIGEMWESITAGAEAMSASVETALGPLVALAAVFEVFEKVSSMAGAISGLNNLSKATGVSVSDLYSLQKTMEENHVPADNLGTTMSRLANNVMLASEGSKQQALAFQQLGISASELHDPNLNLITVLGQVADHLHTSKTKTADLAAAYQVLGRGSQNLIAMLNGGSEALHNQMAQFKNAGDEEQKSAEHADQFEAAETKLTSSLETGLLPILPVLTVAFQMVANVIQVAKGIVVEAFDAIWAAIKTVGKALADLGELFAGVALGSWSMIKDGALNAAKDIKSGIEEQWSDLKQNTLSTATDMVNTWKSAAAEVKPIAPESGAIGTGMPTHHGKDKSAKEAEQQAKEFERAKQMGYEAAARSAQQYERDQARSLQVVTQQFEKANSDQMASTRASIADMKRAVDEYFGEQQKQIKDSAQFQIKQLAVLAKQHKISRQEELLAEQAVYQREHDDLVASLRDQESQLDKSDANYLSAKQRLYNQIAEQDRKLKTNLQSAQAQYENSVEASGKRMTDTMTRGFDQAFQGVYQGTQSLSQAFARMGQDIIGTFAQAMERMVIQFVVSHLIMRKVGAHTAQTQIGQEAAKAASGAYSAVVGIPIVGPVLAPIAAGVAFAGVEAFGSLASAAGGQWEVPGAEQLTMLHRQEMVLPAQHAEALRQTVEGGGGGGGAQHVHLHVHAADAQSVQRLFDQNGAALARTLRGLHRKGALA